MTELQQLRYENNCLKNLIRRLPENKDTHIARKLVGPLKWEKNNVKAK